MGYSHKNSCKKFRKSCKSFRILHTLTLFSVYFASFICVHAGIEVSNSTPPHRPGSSGLQWAVLRSQSCFAALKGGLHCSCSVGSLRAYASIGMALSSQLRFELPAGIRAGLSSVLSLAAELRCEIARVHSIRAAAVRDPLGFYPPLSTPAVRFRFSRPQRASATPPPLPCREVGTGWQCTESTLRVLYSSRMMTREGIQTRMITERRILLPGMEMEGRVYRSGRTESVMTRGEGMRVDRPTGAVEG